MTNKLRDEAERIAIESYNCKQCNGTGSYVGSVEGRDGEEEMVEVQCNCYAQIIYQMTEALLAFKGEDADIEKLAKDFVCVGEYEKEVKAKIAKLEHENKNLYGSIGNQNKRIEQLTDALRPFANMSECIENDKDFHIDGDCWIKAKEVLSGRNATN
jgi:predicted RNase H-like nuclease (RuvC/YqgF family)